MDPDEGYDPEKAAMAVMEDNIRRAYDNGYRDGKADAETSQYSDRHVLAGALVKSDLMARYSEYAREAHPKTMTTDSPEDLALDWADAILVALSQPPPEREDPDAPPTALERPYCVYPRWSDIDRVWLCCHGGTNCGGCRSWPHQCTPTDAN